MTIGRQLYKSFGLVVLTLGILLIVDIGAILQGACRRARTRKTPWTACSTIEAVRSQIMQNRLNLNNFLLSGDPRDEDKVNKGFNDLADAVKSGRVAVRE